MNHIPSTRLQAVLFDWAGTVVDHGSLAPVEVFVEVMRRSGVEITVAEAREPMGMAKREHLAAILALPRVVNAWKSHHGQPPAEADLDRLYADFLPLQDEVIARYSQVIPGVPEMLAICRQRGLKIGSSTGYTQALMDVLVPLARQGGFDPEVVICSDNVRRGRPAPWMIYHAAEQLGVFPMSKILVVDDTVPGIKAAQNAGAWAVAVTRTGNSLGLSLEELSKTDPDELQSRLKTAEAMFQTAGADYVLETAADLIGVLDQIEAGPSKRNDRS